MVRPRIIAGEESEKITFSISDDHGERLRKIAARENRSMSSVVREALENYLKGMDE